MVSKNSAAAGEMRTAKSSSDGCGRLRLWSTSGAAAPSEQRSRSGNRKELSSLTKLTDVSYPDRAALSRVGLGAANCLDEDAKYLRLIAASFKSPLTRPRFACDLAAAWRK